MQATSTPLLSMDSFIGCSLAVASRVELFFSYSLLLPLLLSSCIGLFFQMSLTSRFCAPGCAKDMDLTSCIAIVFR
ncbi:hypothetical protein TNIN_282501 [Trichonephila inaurata madagascariensis]|uniref:Uncharacterized protein n=1 Tax=Trichonephila inaurata madagascariensis TaxID=2747483 RepID=A0A8X6JSF7_9ARAC|nr:hypothetical protein TNIN_282501 [Trichonephila inaurata madagascariensis]